MKLDYFNQYLDKNLEIALKFIDKFKDTFKIHRLITSK